jgi:hypothetical protein
VRKLIFLLLVVSLLVPSTVFADEEEMIRALQIQVDELSAKIDKLIELVELLSTCETAKKDPMGAELEFGKKTYLVPDDLKYGFWSYKSDNQKGECHINVFSDASASLDCLLDFQVAKQGYFAVNSRVKVVEVSSSNGTKCEIEFYKDL